MDLAWDVVLGWGGVVLGEGWLLSVGGGGRFGPTRLQFIVDLSPFVDASHIEYVFVKGVWSSWVLFLSICRGLLTPPM